MPLPKLVFLEGRIAFEDHEQTKRYAALSGNVPMEIHVMTPALAEDFLDEYEADVEAG